MLTFRQKIFFSYLIAFLFFLILLFPYSSKSVRNTIRHILEDRTQRVISTIAGARNIQGMIDILSANQSLVFFRVTLLSDDGRVLYESHADRSALPLYKRHPEIEEALSHRIGYHEDYSYHFGEQFAYIAQAFKFQGQTFILRTAFPLNQINDMSKNFKWVLIKFGIGILVLFTLLTWTIISLLTRPIQHIIEKVRPYQIGQEDELPKIEFEDKRTTKDFVQLAETLNSLSDRIRAQVATLREERNQTEIVLNSLAEGVIAVDNTLRISYVNDVACKMFNIDRASLIDQHISILKEQKCLSLLEKSLELHKTLYDTLDLTEGDKKIPLGVIVTPKQDQGALLVLQDKSNLFQILDMGKAFIANASHEFKTPITVIQGYAETFIEHPDLDEEIQKEMFNKILSNCLRMNSLIQKLLTLTDIESLPLSQFKSCNLVDIIKECMGNVKAIYKEVSIDLETKGEGPFQVIADPDLLYRCFMNLLENGAKYSKDKPKLHVELSIQDHLVKTVISDQGMGIPTKDLPHIFDRFYRVDKARSRKMGGSGLGLSIVKTIIDKFKGTIVAQSKVDVGTTFTIHLPDEESFTDNEQ